MPELSASVELPPPALGQMLDAAAHEVHGMYRVPDQLPRGCSGSMCFGPNGSVTAFMSVKRISPNSCQVALSSWPADT